MNSGEIERKASKAGQDRQSQPITASKEHHGDASTITTQKHFVAVLFRERLYWSLYFQTPHQNQLQKSQQLLTIFPATVPLVGVGPKPTVIKMLGAEGNRET